MNIRKCWVVVLLGLLLAVPSLAAEFKSAKEAIDKGTALLDKGEYDKAIAAFSEVIWFEPKNAEAYNGRGRAYERTGDLDKAILDFTQAILLVPSFVEALTNRGNAYVMQGGWQSVSRGETGGQFRGIRGPRRRGRIAAKLGARTGGAKEWVEQRERRD